VHLDLLRLQGEVLRYKAAPEAGVMTDRMLFDLLTKPLPTEGGPWKIHKDAETERRKAERPDDFHGDGQVVSANVGSPLDYQSRFFGSRPAS
jgi:hypothetical protein